jgi:hypothetical protein
VDGLDLAIWQTNFATAAPDGTAATGDADGDDDVDGDDFLVWQRNFAPTPAPVTANVPEPTAIAMTLMALCIAGIRGRSSRGTARRHAARWTYDGR